MPAPTIGVRWSSNSDASRPASRMPAISASDLRWTDIRRRSSSLMLVFARVFASTCLTMTAQYRLWLPSAAGRLPATTTLPAGTRP